MVYESVSLKPSKSITNDGRSIEPFKLDQLIANVEILRAFCLENPCETNVNFMRRVDRMLPALKFFHMVAPDFFFADLTEIGFIALFRIATAYSNKVAQQIRTQNRIDPDFEVLLKLFDLCMDAVPEIYEDLKREQKEDAINSRVSNCKLHVRRKMGLKNPHVYRLLSELVNHLYSVNIIHLNRLI